MTKYHLKFWSKASGRTSNELIAALEIERIYINADDRSSLGYIERRMTEGERGADGYYDQHRRAKGDTTVTTSDVITSTIDPSAMDALLAAIVGHSPAYARMNFSHPFDRFTALKSHARGINWACSRAQRAELKRQAAFEIEL